MVDHLGQCKRHVAVDLLDLATTRIDVLDIIGKMLAACDSSNNELALLVAQYFGVHGRSLFFAVGFIL
jgi:hypothetical protein